MTDTAPKTPALKLSYFDFHGGRGEPARLALSIGGVPFEDDRVAPPNWPAMKASTPFGQLPVLEVDGVVISQCNTINRYVGKLSGLYPEDALEAARCDEACDVVESLAGEVLASYRMEGEAKRLERERLVAGPITTALTGLSAKLAATGDQWFADGRLTIADLKVAESMRNIGAGVLDHVPTDLAARVAPNLVAHRERVLAHPGVKAYYERVLG